MSSTFERFRPITAKRNPTVTGSYSDPIRNIDWVLMGSVISLVVIGLFFARRLAADLGMTWLSTLHSLRPGRSDIPYGVALALGGFAVLPATAWMP